MFSSLEVGGKIALYYNDHIPPFMMNAFKELDLEKVESICQMYDIEPKSRIEQYCLSAGFKIIKRLRVLQRTICLQNRGKLWLNWLWSRTHGVFDLSPVTMASRKP